MTSSDNLLAQCLDSIPLHLDNFEEFGLAQTTPYILTSPRSLQACSELNIQPTDLVYHSLEEYEETLPYLRLSEIYKIYEDNETERQEKLLRCREMRNNLIMAQYGRGRRISGNSNCNDRIPSGGSRSRTSTSERRSARTSGTAISDGSSRRRVRLATAPAAANDDERRRRKGKVVHVQYCSETESQGDENEERSRSQSRGRSRSRPYSQREIFATKSVPDLSRSKSNLDFHKISPLTWSPRICSIGSLTNDNQILSDYMMRYGDFISTNDLTRDDRKILELLLLKKGREMERDKLSQQLRSVIENDRLKRIRETNLWHQRWQDRLSEKRRLENIENTNRFLALENQWRNNREGLLNYLEHRDNKVQKYLEDLQYQRKKQLLEKQQNEAIRQLEVGRALDKLLDEDRQHRQALSEKLQVRMREAEIRKRRKEQDTWRHIQEMNRLEDMKRVLKHEQVEQSARKALEELRMHLEEKEQRASTNYMNRLQRRNMMLNQGAGNRNKCLEKARALHAELLAGLEEWHKHVLSLNLAAQERATLNYSHEISRRRARIASERALREERALEMLRKVKEKEEKQRELVMDVIETKNCKIARVKAEKERRIMYSRLRAQLGAEMRQKLREKIDPESFDKKAARAEIELKLFKKSSGTGSFNRKINSAPRTTYNGRHFRQPPPHCICKHKK